ncbi:MAG: hypothetical protein ACLVDB_10855 [Anaeromassilibacillus sp.]
MKRNMKTRLFSGLIALCMLLTFLPTTAFAADGDVAQVGDKTYATLDQAVEEAPEGSTITLLQDCELTKGFNKTLTLPEMVKSPLTASLPATAKVGCALASMTPAAF